MDYGLDYIVKLISIQWKETLSLDLRTAFINTRQSPEELVPDSALARLEGDPVIIRYTLDNRPAVNPYYPFLDILSGLIKALPPDKAQAVFRHPSLYPFHRQVLKSYFLEGRASRNEEIILEELDYEKQQILHSLFNLLTLLSDRPMLVLVSNLHYATHSSLNFVRHVMKSGCKKPIFFLFTLDRDHRFIEAGRNLDWERFVNFISESKSLLNIQPEGRKPPRQEDEPARQLPGAEAWLELARNSYHLLALSECRDYCTGLLGLVGGSRARLDPGSHCLLLQLLGDVLQFAGENDAALIQYDALLDQGRESESALWMSAAYRRIAMIHFKKESYESATRFGAQSIKMSESARDEREIFYSHLALFQIKERHTEEFGDVLENVYPRLIGLAKKLKMTNTMAFLFSRLSFIEVYFSTSIGMALKYCNFAARIARRFRNAFRLANVYYIKASIILLKEFNDDVLKYYKKSERLYLGMGSRLELARLYNSIGYLYFSIEKYEESHQNYIKALHLLKEMRNYEEIALTFYNIAMIYFFIQKYGVCAQYLEKILAIMDILDIRGIPFHSLFEIYTHAAICFVKTGSHSRALEYIYKLRQMPPSALHGDLFYYHLLQAFLSVEDKDADAADGHFQDAIRVIDKQDRETLNKVFKLLAPIFYYEYGVFQKGLGRMDRAVEIFKTGLAFCDENQFHFRKNLILQEMPGESFEFREFYFKQSGFNIQSVIDYAKQDANLNKLHKKIDEINFLNNLQNILGRNYSRDMLIRHFMELVNNSFVVDSSFILVRDNREWKILYPLALVEDLGFDFRETLSYLSLNKSEKLVDSVRDDSFLQDVLPGYQTLIFIPLLFDEEVFGALLLMNKKDNLDLNHDNLRIFSIACKQLTAALEKLDLIETLRIRQRVIEQDLRQAVLVQKSILTPAAYFKRLTEMEIDVQFLPMNDKVSGDYYNIMKISDSIVTCTIADITGHGVQAALSTMQIDVINKECLVIASPEERMEYINSMMLKELRNTCFFTCFIINFTCGRVQYCGAGHHPQYLVRPSEKKIIEMCSSGKMLGIQESVKYALGEEPTEKGDFVILLTDGIYEEFNAEGEILGEDGFIANIRDCLEAGMAGWGPAELNQRLLEKTRAFMGGNPINDDITLVTIKIK